MIPRVNATDASRGVRPVANAFSESSFIIYTRGVGRPAANATFSTLRNISRCSALSGFISVAPTLFSIIASPNAHDINNHIAHAINVGIATDIVTSIACSSGVTIQVNKNINAIKISGNSATSIIVLMLLLRM